MGTGTNKVSKSSVDWKMMEAERRLVNFKGCLDGKPGLSNAEFKVLKSNDKEAQALYQKYKAKYSFPKRNLNWLFIHARDNLLNGIKEIIKNGNRRNYHLKGLTFYYSLREDTSSLISNFGDVYFHARNRLFGKQAEMFRNYLVEELNKKGVNFRKGDDSKFRAKGLNLMRGVNLHRDVRLYVYPTKRGGWNYLIEFSPPPCSGGGGVPNS